MTPPNTPSRVPGQDSDVDPQVTPTQAPDTPQATDETQKTPETNEETREGLDEASEAVSGSLDSMFEDLKSMLGPLLEDLIKTLEELLASFKDSLSGGNEQEVVMSQSEIADSPIIQALPEDQRAYVLSLARSISTNQGIRRIRIDNEISSRDGFLRDFTNALKAKGVTTIIGSVPLPEGQIEIIENGVRIIGLSQIPSDLSSVNSPFYTMLNGLYINFDANFNSPNICITTPGVMGQISHMMLYLAKHPEKTVDQVISDLGYSSLVTENDGNYRIRENLERIKNDNAIRERITGNSESTVATSD